MDSIHSPFRYAGGKYYARNLILSRFCTHDAYCEPFVGGGSIFFHKPKVAHNLLNDQDAELVGVYRIIRDQCDALVEFLATMAPPSRDSHAYYKNEFVPRSEIEQAARWYYLNRISYSGIMKRQNCFWGYTAKNSMRPDHWPRTLRAASAKLHDVQITNEDFATTIEQAANGTLLFIDPPYFNAAQDKFYIPSFSAESHVRLANTLREHASRLSFLLTYDDCVEVRALYDWATSAEANEWTYCLSHEPDKSRKGKRSKGKEVFIRNYVVGSEAIFAMTENVSCSVPCRKNW